MRRWKTALSPIVPALCLASLPVLAGAAGAPVAWASAASVAASTSTLAGAGLPAPPWGPLLPAGSVQPGGPLLPSGALRPGGLSQPLGRSLSLHGSRSQSPNWSGYDVTGGPFTSVTATWTQPRVRPSADFTDAAFWVGLDGDSADPSVPAQTVEQIGTEGYSLQGVHYDAWYEMYPDYAHYITFGKGSSRRLMAIHPGDVITASVTWNGTSSFTLSLVEQDDRALVFDRPDDREGRVSTRALVGRSDRRGALAERRLTALGGQLRAGAVPRLRLRRPADRSVRLVSHRHGLAGTLTPPKSPRRR